MIHYKKIAIEGNIGAGKSTLTHYLSKKYSLNAIYEDFENNSFLKKFYQGKESELYALENSFLESRIKTLIDSRWNKNSSCVADFWIEKSLLFANINLENLDKKECFFHKFELLKKDVHPPDLIIYLKSSPDYVNKRIKLRGRKMEKNIKLNYLEIIHESYELLFNKNIDIPILEIDTEQFNNLENNQLTAKLESFLLRKNEKTYTILLK